MLRRHRCSFLGLFFLLLLLLLLLLPLKALVLRAARLLAGIFERWRVLVTRWRLLLLGVN